MEFLYPNMLYGLFAVAIPILVHLFNFRRYRKVYFSNVEMLKSIHKKTKKQSELKHLLVLLTRILTIIAIVFAFAGPFIPNKESKLDQQDKQFVSIYLDNSFSMTHIGENGSLLNEAQNMALNILESYEASDYFHLITNDMLGKHHRWFNKMEMTQNIMDVQAVHIQQDLDDVLQREKMLRTQKKEQNKQAVLYLLSDFQKSSTQIEDLSADTNLLVRMIPLQNNPVNNLSVDSLWFEYPVQLPHTVSVVHVKISNSGEEKQSNIPLRLFINQEQKAVVSLDIEANQSRIIDLSFTNSDRGSFTAMVEIDDYPINFDDRLYFTFSVRDLFKVAMIYQNSPNSYLNHLFGNDSLVEWNTFSVKAVNYNQLATQDLVILNELDQMGSGLQQEISQYVSKGGQVLVIPSSKGDVKQINSWLKLMDAPLFSSLDTNRSRFGEIDKQLPFFNRVFEKEFQKREKSQKLDMPLIRKSFPISVSKEHTQKLLSSQGGKALLTVTEKDAGRIFQMALAVSLDFSALPEHALFVAVFYQMVLQSQDLKPIYEDLGSGQIVEISVNHHRSDFHADEVIHIRQGEEEWIPEIKRKSKYEWMLLNIQWPKDGIFNLLLQDTVIGQLAVNYNRNESNFTTWSSEDLLQQIAAAQLQNFQLLKTTPDQVSMSIIKLDQGISLWKLFVVFAILFIFVETLILRLWK
ncbi:MAG: hypothetical protein GQ527_06345 [Bacteroidales bacterium]|nr:hypothetical protein [Bacteroidales bacterium]